MLGVPLQTKSNSGAVSKLHELEVQCQTHPLLDTLYPSLHCMLAFSFCSFGRVPANQASKPSSPGA